MRQNPGEISKPQNETTRSLARFDWLEPALGVELIELSDLLLIATHAELMLEGIELGVPVVDRCDELKEPAGHIGYYSVQLDPASDLLPSLQLSGA